MADTFYENPGFDQGAMQDLTAICPACDSDGFRSGTDSCEHCGWSQPSLSTTRVTMYDYPDYYVCDHCDKTLGQVDTLCDDCYVSRGK